jgi:hypothetical protein
VSAALQTTQEPAFTPFSREFLDDAFYGPDAMFLDGIVSMTSDAITCRLPTDQPFPLTVSQRGDERTHPRHVNGGILVHVTGMLGWAHAYHLMGLRHKDGWVGYGTHVHTATFKKLVTLGPPVFCTGRLLRARRLHGKIFGTYAIRYEQGGDDVFVSEQSAIWLRP